MRKAAQDSLSSEVVIAGSCFPRSCRLTSKADFQSVFDQPKKAASQGILILYRPSGREYPRLGIMIGKQHVRRAVDRNRLRRIVRDSFRQVQTLLSGLDIVVLIRHDWIALPNAKCRDELAKLWKKIAQK